MNKKQIRIISSQNMKTNEIKTSQPTSRPQSVNKNNKNRLVIG